MSLNSALGHSTTRFIEGKFHQEEELLKRSKLESQEKGIARQLVPKCLRKQGGSTFVRSSVWRTAV
jgi:hypothetical protein